MLNETILSFSFSIHKPSFFKASAQNWSPIFLGKVYNYSCDTTNTIFSLWADSLLVSGQDTTYYLNRVILPCDTCTISNYPNLYGYPEIIFMLKNQPLFLRRELTLLNNGKIIFISPDTIVIDKTIQVGNSWIFDTTNNLQATVIFKNYSNVLGTPDSLIGILLNSNDTIILSKNNGIVKWPCTPGNYFRIIGIEGPDTIGYHVPDSSEIYNFHVGDIFHYYDARGWPCYIHSSDISFKIDSIIYNTNEQSYVANYCSYTILEDCSAGVYNYWSGAGANNCNIDFLSCFPINNEIDFRIEHCRSFQDTCFNPYPIYYSIIKLYRENNLTVFEQLPFEYESLISLGYSSLYKDIIACTRHEDYSHHILIKEKQGLIENILNNFEVGSCRIVTFYVLNGDTLIPTNVLCASWLKIENINNENKISIYPNPTRGSFQIKGIEDGKIEIISIEGKNVYSEKINNIVSGESKIIHLESNILPGIYILNIEQKENTSSFKLIIN